ncbi:hypothetical protein N7G274_004797 [Stereocaulon virgatum]|uniref:L-gulonate 3-dehydrogenase n=1 Tax=Stereocaulon virgatum TaxID=373712 RepID=A0ABR4AFZ3_9LECA
MSPPKPINITIIGAGTIGLSFAALHISHASRTGSTLYVTIHDTRPDIREHILKTLPTYIPCNVSKSSSDRPFGYEVKVDDSVSVQRLFINDDLESAVEDADIVQEQGPENAEFKTALWPDVEKYCPPNALLWSSTSGIPVSTQCLAMKDPSRLLVVHPYNPPHIMPLLEIVPSPATDPKVIERTLEYWKDKDRTPLVLRKETTGFVANRLAYALLREAIYLVQEGVASVKDIDDLMTSSMGPRWAVAGIFKSYHAGGGAGGLEGFFKNIGGTVQACWDDIGTVNVGQGWEEDIFRQTKEAYGVVDTKERDRKTRAVLDAVKLL